MKWGHFTLTFYINTVKLFLLEREQWTLFKAEKCSLNLDDVIRNWNDSDATKWQKQPFRGVS